MTMNKRFRRLLSGVVALAGLVALGPQAIAGTVYQGGSGMPFNNAPLGNYTVTDGTACFTSGRVWVVRVPVPTSTGTVSRSLSASYGNVAAAEAFSFTNGGAVFQGVHFGGTGIATLQVPVNGTLFARFLATSSSTLQACVRSVTALF